MENYQGDLADIIRASGGGGTLGGSSSGDFSDWHFQSDSKNYHSGIDYPSDDFGIPFSTQRDPLLHEPDMPPSTFFNNLENSLGFGGAGGGFDAQKIILDEEIKRPYSNNIFSRMLQISPNAAKLPMSPCESSMMAASPRVAPKPPPPPPTSSVSNNDMISGCNSSRASCLIENTGVQISSPRNTGIKRRKSQAKKVVCIPAPAPANSRPTGEIVPSDLWAWRKYGQKPIKGSPYPRGYYRCSSSKGCSARKQVERSRTDPNMLVITYTSEHNHPWPTQRNALAGSTRTQPAAKNISTASKNSPGSQSGKAAAPPSLKEEQKEGNANNVSSSMEIMDNNNNSTAVKEEEMDQEIEKQEMEDGDQFSEGFDHQSYRPALPDQSNINLLDQDFFADLGEIEADPLNLLFTQGFSGDEERESIKELDPFSFYDWTGNSNNTTFGDQVKRGL